MDTNLPSFTTPPPPVLVQTWLLMAHKKGEHFHYPRKRATDLLELIFGSLTNAQQYVDENKKHDETTNVA
jgi:hypothetical protein